MIKFERKGGCGMDRKEDNQAKLFLIIIPIGIFIMAAIGLLFGFPYALLVAVLYFPLACLKLLKKK